MSSRKRSGPLNVLVGISYVTMIAVNALANILPINGIGTGQVSDSYPNLFAPTGLTFAIWGVIYLLLAAYLLFQFGLFRDGKERISAETATRTALLFSLSSFANAAWIFCWHYGRIGLSLILMLVILVSLVIIVTGFRGRSLSKRERYFVRLPFSVYFGWITVATIANVTALLVDIGWNGLGFSESTWTVVILIVGAAIGIATIRTNRDVAYGLVFLWAYLGIWLKHTSYDGFRSQYPMVIITVISCFVLIVLVEFSLLLARRKRREA